MAHLPIIDQIRNAFRSPRLPFRLRGAVVFGSYAKGVASPDSDIDLLVVADGIHPLRQRREKEIVALKHLLPFHPLDILLLTPEEVHANFRNHNPLFLDIAEEGILIRDERHRLENLMQETRSYIRRKGIQRFGDGWYFPGKKGVPTPLSKVSNADLANAMLHDGQRDFEIGRRLLEERYYDKAVYHFQQAVEKGVKAILAALGVFQRTHYVATVLRRVVQDVTSPKEWKQRLLDMADISETMEPQVSLSRYPGIIEDTLWIPADEYGLEDAQSAYEKAARVLQTGAMFLEHWFSKSSKEDAQQA